MTEVVDGKADGGWMGCNVDFGNDESLELDFRRPEPPWLSIGPGITAADVWFKGIGGIPDVRFRIERTEDGIQVQIDRGAQSELWWPREAQPRLRVAFDQRASTVTASA